MQKVLFIRDSEDFSLRDSAYFITAADTIAKLHALGAVIHVVDSPNEHGWQGARLDKVHELMCDFPGAFWPKQYTNPDNPAAFAAIAEELVDDIGQVDALVAPVGSGGLLCGTARALKQFCPKLLVVAVDAVGSVIFDQPHNSNRLLNGLGNSLVPSNVDKRIIDDVHWLNDDEGFAATLRLAYDEQIFAGGSAGSAYWVSRWLAAEMSTGSTVVVMFPDRGDRYYQTVYDPHYREAHGLCLGQLPSSPQEVVYGLPVTSWSYAKIQ